MIIGVQKQLKVLGNQLKTLGLNVAMLDGQTCKIDAFVYCGDEIKILDIIRNSEEIGFMDGANGVLLVDSRGKTCDEVAQVIRNRVYSPLF